MNEHLSNTLNTFLAMLRSRKVWAAIAGTIISFLPILFSDPQMSREQKKDLWEKTITAVMTLWGGVIVMNGVEDAADKIGQRRQQPLVIPQGKEGLKVVESESKSTVVTTSPAAVGVATPTDTAAATQSPMSRSNQQSVMGTAVVGGRSSLSDPPQSPTAKMDEPTV